MVYTDGSLTEEGAGIGIAGYHGDTLVFTDSYPIPPRLQLQTLK